MDGTEQRGGDLKILKRDGQAGSRGGCLKKRGGGGWSPLTNYEIHKPKNTCDIKSPISKYFYFQLVHVWFYSVYLIVDTFSGTVDNSHRTYKNFCKIISLYKI